MNHIIRTGGVIQRRNGIGHSFRIPFAVSRACGLIIEKNCSASHIHLSIHRGVIRKRNQFEKDILIKFHFRIVQDRYFSPGQCESLRNSNRSVYEYKILGVGDRGRAIGHNWIRKYSLIRDRVV